MPGKSVDIELVRQILLATPTVRESAIHGAPSFKLLGRIIACPAIHKSAELNSLLVSIDKLQRTALIKNDPAVFYVTDHYFAYDVILLRLSRVSQKALRDLLDRAVGYVSSRSAAKRPTPRKADVKKSAVPPIHVRKAKRSTMS